MRIEEGFQPTPYTEGNPYTTDTVLPSLLKRIIPPDALPEIHGDLERFGEELLTTIREISAKVEEPRLVQYDQWGRRVDELQTSEGWRGLKAKMQEEGAVGAFYERRYGPASRVYGFAKTFLATGSTHVIFCPLSMTDGCARVIETIGTPEMKRDLLPRLISRNSEVAFTAGQWMTERPGGSDVSQTETVATPIPGASSPYGPVYSLNGFKWFSSATDSDVALALARTGPPGSGSRGLSLFLIPLRRPLLRPRGAPRPSALSNHIKVHRLKHKVGTRIVPTAELTLEGAEAMRLGPEGAGVKLIAPVLNITRVHSAIGSVGGVRRCLAVATAYSRVRAIAGGRTLLKDAPLHVAELAKVGVLYRALVHMVFGVVLLLGKTECGLATAEEEMRLRMLTPAVKAFAADKACTAMEECMAALGGQGYMEENGFGVNIRDCLVEKIWEGTVVVLALDVVRAASKPGVLHAWTTWANNLLGTSAPLLGKQAEPTIRTLGDAIYLIENIYSAPMPPLLPRPALILFSYATSALYLLEHTAWALKTGEPGAQVDMEVFRRWVDESGFHGAVDEVVRFSTGSARDASARLVHDAAIVYSSAAVAQSSEGARARL